MPFSNSQFEVTQYLGNMVGKKDKFLQAIALMNIEWREIRACLEIIDIIKPSMTTKEKNRLKTIKAIAERMGQANYQMDVVSHLAMKIGRSYKTYDGE